MNCDLFKWSIKATHALRANKQNNAFCVLVNNSGLARLDRLISFSPVVIKHNYFVAKIIVLMYCSSLESFVFM